MITADAYDIPSGDFAGSKLDGVHDEAHGRLRRAHKGLLCNKLFQHIVLNGATQLSPGYSPLFCHGNVHGPEDRGRRVDRHGCGQLVHGKPVKEDFHVFQGVDGHTTPATFSARSGVLRIIAHECWHIEGGGQSCLSMIDEVVKPLIGFFSASKARKHPHGPQPAAIHGGLHPAGIRVLSWEAQLGSIIEVFDVARGIQFLYLPAGHGGKTLSTRRAG